MNTLLLKGKPVSDKLRSALKSRVDKLAISNIIPKLAAILIGDDPPSQIYVRNKGWAEDDQAFHAPFHQLGQNHVGVGFDPRYFSQS